MVRSSSKKAAILQEAGKLFSEHGFWDTSISMISTATGVADGTILYHFKSKEELFIAVLQHFKEELVGTFNTYLAQEDFSTGMEMLEKALSFYISQTYKMENRFLLLHRHHYYQIATTNPICWHHLEEIYSSIIHIFEKAIILGQEDGSMRPVSARKKALLIFIMVDGLVRLDSYQLYRINTLYEELIESCRSMLQKHHH